MVQGERSRNNAKVVLETKLVIIGNHLLTKFPVDAEGHLTLSTITALRTQVHWPRWVCGATGCHVWPVVRRAPAGWRLCPAQCTYYYRSLPTSLVTQLGQVLSLLHSLLEGNEAGMVDRMRSLLDMSGLAEAAYDWHARGSSSADKKREEDDLQTTERGGPVPQRPVAGHAVDTKRENESAEAEYRNAKLVYVLLWQLLDPSAHGKLAGNKLAYSFLQEILHMSTTYYVLHATYYLLLTTYNLLLTNDYLPLTTDY